MASTPITSLPAASSIASTDSLLARVSSVTKTATVAVLAVALSALGLAHAEDYWPVPIDGPRTCSSGTTETALTGPACYSTLTFTTSGSSLSMAGYRLHVTDTLTIGSGCVLHNDATATNAGQSGAAGAPTGELATARIDGNNGGNTNSTGGSTSVTSALGGAGGAGGNGSQAGGAAPAATLPVASSAGNVWSRQGLEALSAILGNTYTKCYGGARGGGGGGSAAGTGIGGGGGGGLAWIRAKNIVNNGRISCRGGVGNTSTGANTNGGGGGGGGGGFLVIWCDSWTGSAPDCNGGTGSAGNGTGTAGSNGSAGKCLVFVKGVLRYRSGFGTNAPDINTL